MKYRTIKKLFCDFHSHGWLLSVAAVAQSYPTKTIRIIVSHPAGGSPDILARLSPPLSQRLGQTVIVENRAGANGSLAAEAVSRMEPDGYSLLLAGSSIIATNPFLYPKVSEAILPGSLHSPIWAGLDFILAGVQR